MGLFKKIDEVIATMRYYQEMSRRFAEEAKRDANLTPIVAQPAARADERPLAA